MFSLQRRASCVNGLAAALVLCVLVAGQHQPVTARPDVSRVVHEFIQLFVSDRLSVMSAQALLGGQPGERAGAYWVIRSGSGLEEIVLPGESSGQVASEATMRLKLESGVSLGQLSEYFGPWQTVFESKTSSVSFRIQNTGQRPVMLFVRLYTPRPAADSPVTSIQLRRH
jgi:hypothetical protein